MTLQVSCYVATGTTKSKWHGYKWHCYLTLQQATDHMGLVQLSLYLGGGGGRGRGSDFELRNILVLKMK